MGHQCQQQQAALAEPESAGRLVEYRSAPTGAPEMYRQACIKGCGQQMH
jgi:hypothetical protein